MYSRDKLIILDADGTTVDAFRAIEQTFAHHDMDIGDLERFQKRRHLFKYLGGLKEFPKNLRQQVGKEKRKKLLKTLTEVYREEARLYDGVASLINRLIEQRGVCVGIVTCNITHEPKQTLKQLLKRNGVNAKELDFLTHVPLKQEKSHAFRQTREDFHINPALAYACGDEKKDFHAAVTTCMHPFMVSYGFEDFERLTGKIGVPPEIIARSPSELGDRVLHAMGII